MERPVDPDEYALSELFPSQPLLVPIIEKKLGESLILYRNAQDGDHPSRNVPTSKKGGTRHVRAERRGHPSACRWACVIEDHYGYPMDMEWAKDGESGELFILQARPETVQSRKEADAFRSYRIKSKGRKLASGLSIGDAVVSGRACLIDILAYRPLRRRHDSRDPND